METEPARLGDDRRKRATLRLGMELAGPLLIVVLVAALLNDHFSGIVSSTNTDIPTQYLLNHCFLGDSLRQGTVPGWNPLLMGGAPFAAEPQSGWMYLPAMLFSVLLPCAKSMSLLLVFHLWLAGIGVYAFLRSEGCSRVAATGAGIVLVRRRSCRPAAGAVGTRGRKPRLPLDPRPTRARHGAGRTASPASGRPRFRSRASPFLV